MDNNKQGWLRMESGWLRCLQALFLLLTTLAVMLPLAPDMPQYGLDPSWMFGINQAAAQHLVFGRDMVFTYGPYAAIDNRQYHPAIDHLVLLGSTLLGVAYGALLLLLMQTGRQRLLWCFGLFLAGFMLSRDALLFSYPLLLTVVCCLLFLPEGHTEKLRLAPATGAWLPVFFLPLGLLPLVKGSFLIVSLSTTVLCAVLFWWARRRRSALLCLLLPVLALTLFWRAIGQQLSALPLFLGNLGPIVSGYTDAMGLYGPPVQIISYLLVALLLVGALFLQKPAMGFVRGVLLLSYMLYLFLVFKAGFVRQDEHIRIAGTALAFAAFFALFFLRGRLLVWVALFSLLGWWQLDSAKGVVKLRELYVHTAGKTFAGAWAGLSARVLHPQALPDAYQASLLRIRQQLPVPHFEGTSDMYSDQQAYLLASGNTWSPRPVLQSYSAYTPLLAQLNVAHLQGNRAPNNILFRVEAIDGRLPALEDGPSWPELTSRYTITGFDHDLAYLKRLPGRVAPPDQPLGTVKARLAEEVLLPASTEPLKLTITLHKTLAGKLLTTLLRLPELYIDLTMVTGEQRRFHFIPGMAEAGFIVSPLVEDTQGFIYLASGNPAFIAGNRVRSFTISERHGGGLFWQEYYDVHMSAVALAGDRGASAFVGQDRLSLVPPLPVASAAAHCAFGSVALNGKVPTGTAYVLSGRLAATVRAQAPVALAALPALYFTLTDAAGSTAYIRAARPITDYSDEYPREPLPPFVPGYSMDSDISLLDGRYRLGLAEVHDGVLVPCALAGLPLDIVSTRHMLRASALR